MLSTIIHKLRPGASFLSTLFIFSVSPCYYAIHTGLKIITLILPSWVYCKLDDLLYQQHQRLILFCFESISSVRIFINKEFFEFPIKKESVLYIGNHQSSVDWIICNNLALWKNSEGHVRYVMKSSLGLLPLYGSYLHSHGCVYLNREHFNPETMTKGLKHWKKSNITTWMVIFPEGTRYDATNLSLLEKSKERFTSLNQTPLEHVLFPKYRGSWLLLKNLYSHLDAVYDVTIMFRQSRGSFGGRLSTPQFSDYMMGKCRDIYVNVERIPINEIPLEENLFKLWLYERYKKKNRVLEEFYSDVSEEKLFENYKYSPSPIRKLFPSAALFLGMMTTIMVTQKGRQLYIKSLILGPLLGYSVLIKAWINKAM